MSKPTPTTSPDTTGPRMRDVVELISNANRTSFKTPGTCRALATVNTARRESVAPLVNGSRLMPTTVRARRVRRRLSGRRRRRGEVWSLWKVVGRDRDTGASVATGYFVSEGGEYPYAIAYVEDVTPKSLRLALGIHRNPERAIEATDLRGQYCPKSLLRWLLLPVDRLGRVITTARPFVAGVFQHTTTKVVATGATKREYEFALMTHSGLRDWYEKSGSPVNPTAPELAGAGGDKGTHATAA
jgi:hypothetical protein